MRLRPAAHRARERKTGAIALTRQLRDGRPARIAKAKEPRGLVERLAEGVVEGGAEPRISADALDNKKLGMAARDEQQKIRRPEPRRKARRERMGLEVIDGDERLFVNERDGLGGGEPDHEPADEAGAGGGGNGCQVRKTNARIRERPGDEPIEDLDMGAGGDLGHDTAKGAMGLDL